MHVSPGSQVPSPHVMPHAPQSPGQLVQVSLVAHEASPHVAPQDPQSAAQLVHDSLASHV